VCVIPLIHEYGDAVARLEQLGLTVEDLVHALKAGDAEARAWTEAAPPIMSGMARWGRTNEALRIRLMRKSGAWIYKNPRNLPLTINEPLSMAMVATTGDAGTGDQRYGPSTKYAKGVTVVEAVEQNEQLALFSSVDPEVVGKALGAVAGAASGLKTWIYLYHVTPEGIFSELSLPETISDDGYIDTWRERIIVPMYRFDDTEPATAIPPDDGGDVTVTVERR
jgi:hypothetical protein